MTRPPLIQPTIRGTGMPLAVQGLAFEIDANATVRVAPTGAISVALVGDPLGHVLVRRGFEVKEIALDEATATKLAQLLRGEVVPEKKISAPPTTLKKRPPLRWVECQLSGPILAPLGSKVFRLPADSVLRYNGKAGPRGLLYVKTGGFVHVLGVRGEAVLDPGEAQRLAERWEFLKIGDT